MKFWPVTCAALKSDITPLFSRFVEKRVSACFLAHPLCAKRRRGGLMFCRCFTFIINFFSRFCQTNYLNSYRADLHEICTFGRTFAVDERSGVIFSISQGTLPWQPILWAKSSSNTHVVVRVTFARAAPPAYDEKGNCYTGHRQTNYLIRRMQANQLINKLAIISMRLEG